MTAYFTGEKHEGGLLIAVGLAMQAALMLSPDLFAEVRSSDYLQALNNFIW
jgi:hypothetical protein